MGKARYEFSEGSSNKFWEIELSGTSFTTSHGRIGTPGATLVKDWDDEDTAKKEYDKLVAQKVKKGYELVSGKPEKATPAGKVARAKKADVPVVEAATAGAYNAALAKQIDADPSDAGAWAVYADWLQGEGDPRGELATVQERLRAKPKDKALASAEKALLKQHAEAIVGDLAVYLTRSEKKDIPGVLAKQPLEPEFRSVDGSNVPVRVIWRGGFFEEVFVGDPGEDWIPYRGKGGDDDEDGDGDGIASIDVAELLGKVLDQPAARFLTSLRLGMPNAWDDGSTDFSDVFKVLAKHDATKRLRSLYIGDIASEESECSWIDPGNPSKLYPALAKLRTLTIRGGSGLELGKIALPELRELRIVTGGLDKSNLKAICAAKWPKLETLELWIGTSRYGGDVALKDLAPLLGGKPFPKLKHLGLRNCEFADELAAALPAAAIVEQLETLDLSKGTMGEAGVSALAEHADAFAHLKRLDLSDNFLGGASRLAGTICKAVRTKPQRTPYEYDGEQQRYVALGE
jgi:uncharacterized protein (TIGR02996 family)